MSEKSDAEYKDGKLHKSCLFKAAKDAQALYDLIAEDDILDDWAAENIRTASETLETVLKYMEYEKEFPAVEDPGPMLDEEAEKDKNNYLSNDDKRYPVPQGAETGDGFVSRCLVDANMKNRYPEQSDRFMACMLIWKEVGKPGAEDAGNPGEKFEDPMELKEEELRDPSKPVLP